VFSSCWYLALRVSTIQIGSEPLKSPLSLFLFAIYTSMCYHCSSSRRRRATSVSGAYHPCAKRISCLCMPCQGKTCSLCYWDCFFLQPVREDVWFTHFSGGYAPFIGTCSCVRRQVLVPNAKRWETGLREVAGYLLAHACSWL